MDVFVEPSYNSLFSPKSSRLSSSICGLNCWDRRAGYVAPLDMSSMETDFFEMKYVQFTK